MLALAVEPEAHVAGPPNGTHAGDGNAGNADRGGGGGGGSGGGGVSVGADARITTASAGSANGARSRLPGGTGSQGCTFEVFLEGRRSRDRRFAPAKTGFLRSLVASGGRHVIVPISLRYVGFHVP